MPGVKSSVRSLQSVNHLRPEASLPVCVAVSITTRRGVLDGVWCSYSISSASHLDAALTLQHRQKCVVAENSREFTRRILYRWVDSWYTACCDLNYYNVGSKNERRLAGECAVLSLHHFLAWNSFPPASPWIWCKFYIPHGERCVI